MKKHSTKKTTSRYKKYRSQPEKPKRLWQWIIAIFIVGLFLIFFTGKRSLLKLYTLHQEKSNLLQQKEKLIEKKNRLSSEVKRLQNDSDYIEKIAREKFNMRKKNEEIYIIEKK